QTGLRKFLDYVQHGSAEKVARLLERGLDPNYHDSDSGGCPHRPPQALLDLGCPQIKGVTPVGATGVSQGCHGVSPGGPKGVTRGSQGCPHRPPQALLDLGGSPNYKDRRGLTPLYHTAMVGGDPRCCELLLYNRAHIGTADENGWQEIHQVTKCHCHLGHCHLGH
ncbi:SHAN1 protein, partial [Quiscalus mexicanus]|nr:SHAN1 protein [Quiscalus mexicanus]